MGKKLKVMLLTSVLTLSIAVTASATVVSTELNVEVPLQQDTVVVPMDIPVEMQGLTYQDIALMSDAERAERGIYQGRILQNGVNIRSGPGSQYKSLGMMNKGNTVWIHGWYSGEVLNNDPGILWAYCLCDSPNKGVYGYIYGSYVLPID